MEHEMFKTLTEMSRRIDNANNALVSQKMRLIKLERNQADLRVQLDGFSESVTKFAMDTVSAVTSVKKIADNANTSAVCAIIVGLGAGLGAFAFAAGVAIQHDTLDARCMQTEQRLNNEIGSLKRKIEYCEEFAIPELQKEIEKLKKEVHGDGKDANTEN